MGSSADRNREGENPDQRSKGATDSFESLPLKSDEHALPRL
jgi:hypothetical protein